MQVKELLRQSVIAAVYVVLSLSLFQLSFGAGMIEFRVAEALMVLPFYNKKNIFGVTVGCLVTNLFSPLGIADIVFGTGATLLAALLIALIRKKYLIAILTAAVNGFVIAAELHLILGLPFWLSVISIAASELIIVQIGVLLFHILERNSQLKQLILD